MSDPERERLRRVFADHRPVPGGLCLCGWAYPCELRMVALADNARWVREQIRAVERPC